MEENGRIDSEDSGNDSQSCLSALTFEACENTLVNNITLTDGRMYNGETMEQKMSTTPAEAMTVGPEISAGFSGDSQPHDSPVQQNMFQNDIAALSHGQTEVKVEEDSNDAPNMEAPEVDIDFGGNENEEILPDMKGSWQPAVSDIIAEHSSVVKVEAASPVFEDEPGGEPEGMFYGDTSHIGGQQFKQEELEVELCNQEEHIRYEVEATAVVKREERVLPGVLEDNMFTSNDDNMPPCVSQEEVIVDCADTDPQEVEVPLSYSGTFNNFKDAKVTVEINEEEVDILGAAATEVKHHNYSDEDSESSHQTMGRYNQPLQHAMYHAMAPLSHNGRGNAVPYTNQMMSNGYNKGVKRDYSHDVPFEGPVRTKAARKITPPSPVKKEIGLDSPDINCANKSLEENLRKQELDETFFTCDFCFKLFRRRNALMAHIKLHEALNIGNHNGNIFECKQCRKTYSSRYNLIHHMKRCHGDKEYKCIKCDVAYATQSDLTRHARTHGGKSYKCNRCGKEFQKRKTFAAHAKVHRQVIYECISCPKKFSWEEELVEHNKVHQIPDGTPVTALTIASNSNTAASIKTEPVVDDSKNHQKQTAHLKLDYCYAYIKRVKAQFISQPHVYQEFLNTIKKFKFKSIDINHFLDRISYLFRDHPSLINGFNIFLPEECKVEVPMSPTNALAVHDPLLDQQLNPRGELDDSLAYLGLVKARFADRPHIYNTFTYIIKEYKQKSLQIPEVAARVMALLKDHPDLIKGFNTFLPPNNRIDVSLYDSQSSPSHNVLTVDKTNVAPSEPTLHKSNADQDVPKKTAVRSEDTVSLTSTHSLQKTPISNGHIVTESTSLNSMISPTSTENTSAQTPTVSNNTSPTVTKNKTSSGISHPSTHTVIKSNTSVVSNSRNMTSVDKEIIDENSASEYESNIEVNDTSHGDGKSDVRYSKQHKIASISRCKKTSKSENSDSVFFANKESHAQKNISDTDTEGVLESIENERISHRILNSEERKKLIPNEQQQATTLCTNNSVQGDVSEGGKVHVPKSYTNVIAVSPNSSDVSSNIKSTVTFNNSTLPKVLIGSSVMTNRSVQPTTPKYSGTIDTPLTLASTATSKANSLLESSASRCTKKMSPTKIVPLKNNSLLYQQLMSKNNFRRHKNTSVATFTKIEDNNKECVETLNSEPSCPGGDSSSAKTSTTTDSNNPPFKTGSKISVPYVVNSPNSNVIFTLANSMAENNTKVHGVVNNLAISTPTFLATTKSGTVSDHNSRPIYAIPVNGTRTSCAGVALINANALQNISSSNLYTGINIVTSTNSTPSTYTVDSTKSTASLPAAVSSGNGATKQMLLIRTNPSSNTFLISNSGNQVFSNGSSLQSGCLLPMQQAVSGVSGVQISNDIKTSNSNINNLATCTFSNKLLTLPGSKFTLNSNNRVNATNFLAGQKIAIVKTPVTNHLANSTNMNAISVSNIVTLNPTISGNIVSAAGSTPLLTNASLISSSPKKRKIVTNKNIVTTNVNSIKKKIDPIVQNYLNKNRPLLPIGVNKSQTPLVISFVSRKPELGNGREKQIPASEVPICTSSEDVQQCGSSVAGANDQVQPNAPHVGLAASMLKMKTKTTKKHCAVKTVSTVDQTFSDSLHNGTTLTSDTCPKTYSRRDSLIKGDSESRSEMPSEPECAALKNVDSG